MQFIDDLKRRYKAGNITTRIIYLNIIVFICIKLITVLATIIGGGREAIDFIDGSLAVSSNPSILLYRPWTLISYQFVHFDLMHLAINMLWLHWFGTLFLKYYTRRQVLSVYIWGGLFGALLYVIAYNYIPFYSDNGYSGLMVGASASILALVVATAMAAPEDELQLMLIGRVKMKHLALGVIVIDLISVTSGNAGGHISHLGGAIAGYFFANEYLKHNKDMTSWIGKIIDAIANFSLKRKKKSNLKARKTGGKEADREYNQTKKKNEANINIILDKIKASGYKSLTKSEKEELFKASSKH